MSKFYLILLQYVKPVNAIEHYLETHKAFLHKYGENGHFLLSGKKTPRSGGFILCKAKNRQEVETIIREDPFDRNQLAFYEIMEFEPFYFDRALASFLEK